VIRIASCDFKPGKKRWAGAEEEEEEEKERKKTFWLPRDFLVQYFRNAF